MDTFLVRSLLVPSTVLLLGRWNWWPGKLAEMDEADGAPSEGNGGGVEAPAAVAGSPVQEGSPA